MTHEDESRPRRSSVDASGREAANFVHKSDSACPGHTEQTVLTSPVAAWHCWRMRRYQLSRLLLM